VAKQKIAGHFGGVVLIDIRMRRPHLLLLTNSTRLGSQEKVPGGKNRRLETPRQTAARELEEETDLFVFPWKLIEVHSYPSPDDRDPRAIHMKHFFTIAMDHCQGRLRDYPLLQSNIGIPRWEEITQQLLSDVIFRTHREGVLKAISYWSSKSEEVYELARDLNLLYIDPTLESGK
jgi:ADP-ribose pyrophosphatase YjhB (NUDIX family)